MVRRLVRSRNAPRNDSSVSVHRPANAANHGMLLEFTAPESQGLRALFAGFIDLYCESIPELRRAHIKNEIRTLLVEMGVVPELFFSEALGPVRLISSTLLSNLVRRVLVKNGGVPDKLSLPFVGQIEDVLNQSRFRSEFQEIEKIGKGGFGQVYKVRSLLDKHLYAIKMIAARDESEQFSQRFLHEMQILANLQHANIVRYHSGWIELQNTPTASTSSPSFTPPPPPRERKDSPRINIEEIFDSTSSEDASQSIPVEEKENGGGDEISMASMSSVGSAVQKNSPGGKFWNGGGDISSGSSTVFSTTSESALVPVDRRNGEMSITSASSMGSAVVKKVMKPAGGKYWNHEMSGESIEFESTDKNGSPVLATAIPVGRKRGGGGRGDGEWIEGGESGKEVAVMELKVRMIIYIQMELCTSTLEKLLLDRNELLIKESSPVDGKESLSIFRQLLSAVEYIHEKGLIHRDIKPGNLFLKTDPRRPSSIHLLLGDFGLSCLAGDQEWKDADNTRRRYLVPSASHSQGVGTTTYAAPEQMKSTKYGREVDLFSSGIVLLELFSIVGSGSERATVIERLKVERELPKEMEEQWPSICSLVLRLTSPRPEERPTATAVLNELNEDANEIRSLKEMVSNQEAQIRSLRNEVKKLKAELSKKNRTRTGESGSSI